MANMSNWLEQQLLGAIFKGQSYSNQTVYVALCTNTLNDTTTGSQLAEPGGNYQRQATTASDWSVVDGTTFDGTVNNITDIEWEDVTWADTIIAVALVNQASGGEVLFWGQLVNAKTVSVDDSVRFMVGSLVVQIDD